MRVINDREEKSGETPLGFLPLFLQVLLNALGISSGIFGPLPMILAETRLENPWPKVTAVGGALLAMLFLSVSPGTVAVTFVVGLYLADRVKHETKFWPLLLQILVVAVVAGVLGVIIEVPFAGKTLLAYWTSIIDASIEGLKANLPVDAKFPWDDLKRNLYTSAPFYYLSMVVCSFWLSIGFAAHLGWLNENKAYSSSALRALPSSILLSFLFIASAAGEIVFGGRYPVLNGTTALIAFLVIIQGCICLSQALNVRRIPYRTRTLIYSVSLLFGAYLLLGLGIVRPFIRRGKIPPPAEEII